MTRQVHGLVQNPKDFDGSLIIGENQKMARMADFHGFRLSDVTQMKGLGAAQKPGMVPSR